MEKLRHHRIEIERRERSKLPQRQWAGEDPRFFKEFIGVFLEVEPQKRGPKSHDRDFVDRVIRCLVGHFRIRRGEQLETKEIGKHSGAGRRSAVRRRASLPTVDDPIGILPALDPKQAHGREAGKVPDEIYGAKTAGST